MSVELIAIIAVLIVNIVTFFFLNFRISGIFDHLDAKIDRYAQESRNRDDNIILRIDAINARFDALYRDLFNKKAA